MTSVQGYIANYLGGISTIPTSSRHPNEVTDAENCLFSDSKGAYKRPGTKRIVSNLAKWEIDTDDAMIEVFPVGEGVLQTVIVQDGKAHVFWVDTQIDSLPELVDPYDVTTIPPGFPDDLKERILELNVVAIKLPETLGFYRAFRDEQRKLFIRVTPEILENIIEEVNTLIPAIILLPNETDEDKRKKKKEDYIARTESVTHRFGHMVDPQNPDLILSTPVITTTDGSYLKIRTEGSPEESFRVAKNESRLFILNRDVQVELKNDPFPGNTEFGNHWLLYFVALTSGQDVSVTVKYRENGSSKSKPVPLGQIGVETAGKEFATAWEALADRPDGFEVQGSGQVATVRITNTAAITDLSFEFSNIAAATLSEADGIRSVPSFQALPPTAPNNMIVQVTGSAVTRLDDVWVRFEKTTEEE